MNQIRRAAALIGLLMLAGLGSGHAEEKTTGFFDSQGSPNGDFLLAALDKEKGGDVGDFGITLYISGVMDSMTAFRPNLWPELYPNLNKGEIVERVKSYYLNNPDQRHRRVVDVILSGSR